MEKSAPADRRGGKAFRPGPLPKAGQGNHMALDGLVLRSKEWKRLARKMMSKSQASPASAATGAPGPDAVLFREGMSRVAAAVHVVTTDGPSGRAGFTATAVT